MKTHLLSFFAGDDEKILAGLKEAAAEYRGKVGVGFGGRTIL